MRYCLCAKMSKHPGEINDVKTAFPSALLLLDPSHPLRGASLSQSNWSKLLLLCEVNIHHLNKYLVRYSAVSTQLWAKEAFFFFF